MGKLPLPGYYNRTMQADDKLDDLWSPSKFVPDLVVISLGGNDYNHQEGNVPTNDTFTSAYEDFMLRIFEMNGMQIKIAAVCGMGDPTESTRDPDNNRCSPCPHVEDAIDEFKLKYGDQYAVEYVSVPCDGSVVTGDGDIGCAGHKNAIGQKKVADFVTPKLKEYMGW